jgi:hypothetical protein
MNMIIMMIGSGNELRIMDAWMVLKGSRESSGQRDSDGAGSGAGWGQREQFLGPPESARAKWRSFGCCEAVQDSAGTAILIGQRMLYASDLHI